MGESSRTLYLVCYDVANNRRLYRVRRYLAGYRVGGQKSFFECWLTPAELDEVCRTLAEMLDVEADRAHIFQLDQRMPRDYLGVATPPPNRAFMIV